jgi:hypothetical protein
MGAWVSVLTESDSRGATLGDETGEGVRGGTGDDVDPSQA